MVRRSTMRRVRKGKQRARESGHIVTWDVNSADSAAVNRLRRFVFGDISRARGRTYRYPGFVEREGARYLGQSVLLVRPTQLAEIRALISRTAIAPDVPPATLRGRL